MVIWGDVLFLIDFSMDFLCLYFSMRILDLPRNPVRLTTASVLGAAFDVFTLMMPGKKAVTVILSAVYVFIITVTSLPGKTVSVRNIFRHTVLFFFLECGMSGILTIVFSRINMVFRSSGISGIGSETRLRIFWLIMCGISILFLLFTVRLRKKRNSYEVLIEYRGNQIRLPGFLDSGNVAMEPISGLPVTVLPRQVLSKLKIPEKDLEEGNMPRSRLIPVSTVNGHDLLWGFLPDSSELINEKGGKKEFFSYCVIWKSADDKNNDFGCMAILPSVIEDQ